MSQSQRKKAGWHHEIDTLAGGDFEQYIKQTTATIKKWRRLAIIGWSGWAIAIACLIILERTWR